MFNFISAFVKFIKNAITPVQPAPKRHPRIRRDYYNTPVLPSPKEFTTQTKLHILCNVLLKRVMEIHSIVFIALYLPYKRSCRDLQKTTDQCEVDIMSIDELMRSLNDD